MLTDKQAPAVKVQAGFDEDTGKWVVGLIYRRTGLKILCSSQDVAEMLEEHLQNTSPAQFEYLAEEAYRPC